MECSNSHHLSTTHLLEVKILSIQAPMLRYMLQNKSFIQLDTSDGQHFQIDLSSLKAADTYHRVNSSTILSINESFRLFVSESIFSNDRNLDQFMFLTVYTDGTWDGHHATDISLRTSGGLEVGQQGDNRAGDQGRPEASRASEKRKSSSVFSMLMKDKDRDNKDNDRRDGLDGDMSRDTQHVAASSMRKVIKFCNRASVPLSALRSNKLCEVESQVAALKMRCLWKLRIFKIERPPRCDSEAAPAGGGGGGAAICSSHFVVYFADANGDPILIKTPNSNNSNSSSNNNSPRRNSSRSKSVKGLGSIDSEASPSGASASSSSSSKKKKGWIFCSNSKTNIGHVVWGEMDTVEISSELFTEVAHAAKGLLIQFMSRTSSSSSSEVCIGELLLPLCSANKVPEEGMGSLSLEHCTQHRLQLPSALHTLKKASSQTISTRYTAYLQFRTCDIHDPSYDASDRATIKLASSIKSIQSADSSWPCRFMSKVLQGAEAEVFQLFPAYDGLHIYSSTGNPSPSPSYEGGKRRHVNGISSILIDCLERKFVSNGDTNSIHLVVPYSQIEATDMYILTSNMFLVTVALNRCLQSTSNSSSSSTNSSSISSTTSTRIVRFDVLVGPCAAVDLFTVMQNRIVLSFNRSTISAYVAADRSLEDIDSFERIAKTLEEDIYSTILSIAKVRNSLHQSEGEKIDRVALMLKLLYLKKVALKIYLWFLIEQTSLVFGAKSSYLNSTWLLFDNDREGGTTIRDVNELTKRIEEVVMSVNNDTRTLIYASYKQINVTIDDKLTSLIYDKYLAVISLIVDSLELTRKGISSHEGTTSSSSSSSSGGKKIYKTSDPQKKRDLIKYIVTHDNIFELMLSSTLRSHGYQFSVAPLLSICIDFEALIHTFSMLVNENILLWNERTFLHFRMNKEKSKVLTNQDFAPWAVTSMIETATGHELYISNIPETIQTQLNVEIGLKKIPILATTLGTTSLNWLFLLNQKISAAIAKVYLALANEYEKVIAHGVHALLLPANSSKSRVEIAILASTLVDSVKDDLIIFLLSIVNDCHRMCSKHIPDSMSNFQLDDDSAGDMSSSSRQQQDYRNTLLSHSAMLFLKSSRAMDVVIQTAINQLSNQIFLFSDLKQHFISTFGSHILNAKAASSTTTTTSKGSSSHSSIEVICATLKNFFHFVSAHLNKDDIEKLLYICIKKLVLRYLLFLRDIPHLLPLSRGKLSADQVHAVRSDVRSVIRLHSSLKVRINKPLVDHHQQQQDPDPSSVAEAARGTSSEDSQSSSSETTALNQSVITDNTSASIVEESMYSMYFNNSAANLFCVLSEAILIVDGREECSSSSSGKDIRDLMNKHFDNDVRTSNALSIIIYLYHHLNHHFYHHFYHLSVSILDLR